MKSKLVREALHVDKFGNLADDSNPNESKILDWIKQSKGKTISPKTFIDFVDSLIAFKVNRPFAWEAMQKLFDNHKYMHSELGEMPGRDKYAKGWNLFDEYYGDTSKSDPDVVLKEDSYIGPSKAKFDFQFSLDDLIEVIENTRGQKLTPTKLRDFLDFMKETRTPQSKAFNMIKYLFGLHPYMQKDIIKGSGPYKDILDQYLENMDKNDRPRYDVDPRMN